MRVLRLFALGTLLLGLSGAGVRADWNSTISGANPLHWFAFDEAAGATTATDQGSAGANGTYSGAGKVATAGLINGAASFAGTDSVLVGGANLATDWTLEAIFLADTVNGGASMGLIGCDFTATDRMAVKAEQWNKTGQLGYTLFGVVDVTLPAATPTDYTHVALVGTGTGVELFVNGASQGSDPTATALSRYVLGAGAMRADGTLVDGLTGAIDELVIYDRALSAGDIAAHAAAVPEPASAVLSLLALLGLLGCRRRS
jgi:hypothetical protein